jgi:DNA-binding winged helix-turn-helix (wHTH) protein
VLPRRGTDCVARGAAMSSSRAQKFLKMALPRLVMRAQPAPTFRESGVAYCFGPFCLDTEAHLLSRGGQPVALTPKVFDTLLYLVQRPGRLVTKDELMSALWPDAFVNESNITQTIFMLRKALGENSGDHRYIATVPGHGYRFVPEVEQVEDSSRQVAVELQPADTPAPIVTSAPAGASRRTIASLAAIAAVVLMAFGLMRIGKIGKNSAAPTGPIRSVAVLPLKNLSSDPKQAYFAEGMTDELITRLAELKGVRVISHTSVLHYTQSTKTLQRALSIDPNYSTGHQWYADLLSLEGRNQEAITEIRKAEELDPFSAIVFLEAGQVYRRARQYEQAITEYKKSVTIDSHMTLDYYWMSDAYLRLGMVNEASKALRASFAWQPAEQYARNSKAISELETAYFREGLKGWTSKRMIRIRRMANRPSYFLALGYAILGEDEKALQYLNRAYAAHDSEILSINIDPEWDRLRSDLRFQDLLRRIHFPQS